MRTRVTTKKENLPSRVPQGRVRYFKKGTSNNGHGDRRSKLQPREASISCGVSFSDLLKVPKKDIRRAHVMAAQGWDSSPTSEAVLKMISDIYPVLKLKPKFKDKKFNTDASVQDVLVYLLSQFEKLYKNNVDLSYSGYRIIVKEDKYTIEYTTPIELTPDPCFIQLYWIDRLQAVDHQLYELVLYAVILVQRHIRIRGVEQFIKTKRGEGIFYNMFSELEELYTERYAEDYGDDAESTGFDYGLQRHQETLGEYGIGSLASNYAKLFHKGASYVIWKDKFLNYKKKEGPVENLILQFLTAAHQLLQHKKNIDILIADDLHYESYLTIKDTHVFVWRFDDPDDLMMESFYEWMDDHSMNIGVADVTVTNTIAEDKSEELKTFYQSFKMFFNIGNEVSRKIAELL